MTDESAPPDDPAGVGLDRHRADEAIYQGFAPGPEPIVLGEDGLPTLDTPTAHPYAPPLHPKTMVCIGDTSSFVTRDEWGEVTVSFQPEEVSRAADGRYYVPRVEYEKRLAGDKHPATVEYIERVYRGRQEVFPVRPQCKFLARQMTDFQDATGQQFVERLCLARRDSESFFLSLRDTQVHACEMREPRDPESEERLARFDAAKIKLGRERYEEGGEFDVDAALARTEKEADRGLAYGGIFQDQKA